MIGESTLVRTRLGWSGPGLVVEVRDSHPLHSEERFSRISDRMSRPHALVMWCDSGHREWHRVEEICEIDDK
jgi:hypothetical protein